MNKCFQCFECSLIARCWWFFIAHHKIKSTKVLQNKLKNAVTLTRIDIISAVKTPRKQPSLPTYLYITRWVTQMYLNCSKRRWSPSSSISRPCSSTRQVACESAYNLVNRTHVENRGGIEFILVGSKIFLQTEAIRSIAIQTARESHLIARYIFCITIW